LRGLIYHTSLNEYGNDFTDTAVADLTASSWPTCLSSGANHRVSADTTSK